MRTVSIKADIEILPNMQKTANIQLDFRMMTNADEIGTRWTRKDETSNKEYASLFITAPEFGPKKLHAKLGEVVGKETKDFMR